MHTINENEIRELLGKYVMGTITAEEKSALAAIVSNELYLPAVEKILEEEYQSNIFLGEKDSKTGEAIQQFLQRNIQTKTNAFVKKGNFQIWRWAVAASFFVALGAGLYLFTKNNESKKPAHANYTHDLPPGSEGAILTLADGRQITLDSAFSGTVTEEGGALITKKDNLLQYNTQGQEGKVLLNTMRTPRGRQYKLALSDGSVLWLNAASSVTYPTAFAGNERVVQVSGEVYFEVAHNTSNPFIVKLRDGSQVQVLGTHFNINSYDDEAAIKTTLIEGSVKLVKNTTSLTLKPGQQARINNTGISMEKNVDMNEVMAWRNGYFSFNNTDLKTVIQQLSRWYNFDVVYKSGVPRVSFTGEIGRNLSLADVLEILKETRIRAVIEGNQLIIK